jgi:large repetitive protein
MLSHVAKLGATAIAVTALAVGVAVSGAGAASPTTPSPGCADVPLTAPTHLSGAPGNKYAVVSWFPSQFHVPDGCVQGYVVTPSEGKAVVIIGSGTTTKVKGLTNGLTDLFSITSFNGTTFSPPAGILITIGAPTTPTSVATHRVARGVVKVAFDPSDGNGAPVILYTAICTSSDGGARRVKAAEIGPITVSGLTPGKSYTCKVRARNDRGNSAFGGSTVTKA